MPFRHFVGTMALYRQVLRAPAVLSQCQKLATAYQQRCRAYSDMSFTFASPSDVYYKEAVVKQVDVPSIAGSFGILADHVPTIAVLKPGVLSVIEEDGKTKSYFVSTGSVTVNDDSSVQILAEEAHPLERFDPKAVQSNLQKAQSELQSANTEQTKAEAQIAIECLEALSKVVAH